MSIDTMLKVRERVREVVAHLQTEGAPPPIGPVGSKTRDLYDHCLPILRRFAAGDGVSTDDLHRALWGIERAALEASDRQLSKKASMAANYALILCSVGYQEVVRRSFADLMRGLGVRTSEDVVE